LYSWVPTFEEVDLLPPPRRRSVAKVPPLLLPGSQRSFSSSHAAPESKILAQWFFFQLTRLLVLSENSAFCFRFSRELLHAVLPLYFPPTFLLLRLSSNFSRHVFSSPQRPISQKSPVSTWLPLPVPPNKGPFVFPVPLFRSRSSLIGNTNVPVFLEPSSTLGLCGAGPRSLSFLAPTPPAHLPPRTSRTRSSPFCFLP